jgi:hypothetical protein
MHARNANANVRPYRCIAVSKVTAGTLFVLLYMINRDSRKWPGLVVAVLFLTSHLRKLMYVEPDVLG